MVIKLRGLHALGGGIPVGVVYNDESRPSMDQQLEKMWEKTTPKSVEELMDAFKF